MKILNISTIIPLNGLKRENYIVFSIQDYLNKQYGYEFTIAKSLPYAPWFLGLFSKKWKKYQELYSNKEIIVRGYETTLFPWLTPPSSNFRLNYFLLPVNLLWFKYKIQKNLKTFI